MAKSSPNLDDIDPQPVALEVFEGRHVVRYALALTNAGDGLSDAMQIDPQQYHHGQRVTVVITGVISKVGFDPMKGWDEDDPNAQLVRKHTVKAETAKILGTGDVAALDQMMAEQADAVAARKRAEAEAKTGQGALDVDG